MSDAPKGPVGEIATGFETWPDEGDDRIARVLLDQKMIEFYDAQPMAVVERYRRHRIAELLNHAVTHSPWWRERLRDVAARKRVSFADLPLLGRAEYTESVKSSGALPLPATHGRSKKKVTSGSTGIVVEFFTTERAARMNVVHYLHDRVRQRLDPNGTIARFNLIVGERSEEHVVTQAHPLIWRSPELVRRVHQSSAQEHAGWLLRVRPAYIVGLPTFLSGVLEIYERGIVAPPKVEKILTYGETVRPELRDRVASVLGARIIDRYSSEESGPIAFQCPASDAHYHIASTNVHVEILDEEGRATPPGEIGRVYVTAFHNFASPVIRYELGDLSSWQPRCICGHDRPVLTDLLGRERFLIKLPTGERRYTQISPRHLLPVAALREFRVVQVAEGVVHLQCVPETALTADQIEQLTDVLRRVLSPLLTYKVEEVAAIDWGPTYKRQDVMSLI